MKWQDIALICGICFNIGALILTWLVVGNLSQTVGSQAINIEANPINNLLLHVPALQVIFFMGFWGLLIFLYTRGRKYSTTHNTPLAWLSLNSFILSIFFLTMLDFINDFSIILKVLL